MAADRLTHYLKPEQFTIYTREPLAKLVAAARMKAGPHGNVEVLRQFWQLEAEPSRDVVPAILVYADLLATNEPRNLETAKLVYEQHIAPILRQTAQPS
ncbi:MAG: type IV toxin-antitoxin system AbiEi family antitoxin [Bryobacteraceae bacterium]|nr:type IV toxin-antitoxin system AbiEi family antitoxin [Bryobacteraceae bacterium]